MATPRGRRKEFAPTEEILKPTLPEPTPSPVRDHPYSRAVAHFVAEFILRSAETISEVYDHDYEAAILFMTISNRNSEKVMADPKLREAYGSFSKTIPMEHILLISRMALARATAALALLLLFYPDRAEQIRILRADPACLCRRSLQDARQ